LAVFHQQLKVGVEAHSKSPITVEAYSIMQRSSTHPYESIGLAGSA
jgi:hypothetical protein